MARAVLCVCLAALLASSKAYVRAQGEDDYEGAEGEDFFDGSENEGDFMDVGDPYGGYDEYGGDFMDGLGGGMGEEEEANPGDHIRGFLELDDLTFDSSSLRGAALGSSTPWCGHRRTSPGALHPWVRPGRAQTDQPSEGQRGRAQDPAGGSTSRAFRPSSSSTPTALWRTSTAGPWRSLQSLRGLRWARRPSCPSSSPT